MSRHQHLRTNIMKSLIKVESLEAGNVPVTQEMLHIEWSRLLQLPRELRDGIWRTVLAEPSKWDKRHHVECAHHGGVIRSMTAPYRASQDKDPFSRVGATWFPYIGRKEDGKLAYERTRNCFSKCIRRKGLALLRVCRQIRREASPLLWKSNTFCFESPKLFLTVNDGLSFHLDKLFGSYSTIPQPRLDLLVSLSVFSTQDWTPVGVAKAMASIVGDMKCLERLELSLELFDSLHTFGRMCMPPSLKHLNCVNFKTISYSLSSRGNNWAAVDVGLTKEFEIASMRRDAVWPFDHCAVEKYTFCLHCYRIVSKVYRTIEASIKEPFATNGKRWFDDIADKLCLKVQRKYVHQYGNELHWIVPIAMLDGAQYDVRVWGLRALPVERQIEKARDIQKARQVVEAKREARRLECMRAVAMNSVDDAEAEDLTTSREKGKVRRQQAIRREMQHERMWSVTRTSGAREHSRPTIHLVQCGGSWPDRVTRRIDDEKKCQSRKEKKETERRHEAARQKSELKKEAKDLERSEAETRSERKTGRSRLGRKTTGRF